MEYCYSPIGHDFVLGFLIGVYVLRENGECFDITKIIFVMINKFINIVDNWGELRRCTAVIENLAIVRDIEACVTFRMTLTRH